MRIIKTVFLFILIIALNGCGIINMANKFENVNYTIKPPIMEVHGGKIKLEMDISFPPKYFAKQATISLTPVLVHEKGEKAFKEIVLHGEEAKGGEKTIFFETGGVSTYQDIINYEEIMKDSYLEIRGVATAERKLNIEGNKKEQHKLGPKKIASGVIATSRRVLDNEVPSNENHGYEHETILEQKATIYFLVNQSNIRYTEKSSDNINRLKEFVKKRYKTHSIEIISYASPEGSINMNNKVSDNRMKSTVSYTKKLLKSLNLDGAENNNLYKETSMGEDWEGFESVVSSSNIKDKKRINNIVSSVKDVELREQQIRDLSEIYDALENNVLPQLRKADIVIRSYEPKKSDEEIAVLSLENPEELDVNELLFAATLSDDPIVQTNIYNKVVELHNDYRGYNNIACIYLKNGDLERANNFLDKAEKLSVQKGNKDILTNRGIIAARKGNLETAKNYFKQANTNEKNQAILNIRMGEYAKASRYFKGDKSHNATLAHILNGDNNAKCIENTAECHYLNAISAIRKGDNKTAIENLQKAINANNLYKAEAKLDLEFVKLRSDELFINLTE